MITLRNLAVLKEILIMSIESTKLPEAKKIQTKISLDIDFEDLERLIKKEMESKKLQPEVK